MLYSILKLENILVLYVVLVSKSLYYDMLGNNLLLVPLLALLIIRYLSSEQHKISKLGFLYTICFVLISLLSFEQQWSSVFVLLTRLAIGLLLIEIIGFHRFMKSFIRIMLFLGFISLFYYPVIYFDIPSILPDFVALDGRILRNFVFFGVWENFIEHNVYRNSGLWWEPGAFALFINLAFLFMIVSRSVSYMRYLIIFLTIASIYSTTGIIVFLVLSAVLVLDIKKNLTHLFVGFLSLPIVMLGGWYLVLPNLASKFFNANMSFDSRYYDLYISWEMFKDAFWFGYGYGSQIQNAIPFGEGLLGMNMYSRVNPTGSDGITMMIAQLGIFSIVLMLPLVYPKYLSRFTLQQRVLSAMAIILMFNTQNFSFLLIFTVICLYGLNEHSNEPNISR